MKQRNTFPWLASVAALAMAMFLPSQALAQDDPINLVLNTSMSNHSVTVSEDDGIFTVVTSGGDPYVGVTGLHRDLTPGERAFTFEYKSNKSIGVEIFFSRSTGSSYAGGYSLVLGTAPASDEWESVTIDLSQPIDEWGWGKQDYTMRLDPGADAGIIFQIRNMRIIEKSVEGADLSKYNFTYDQDGCILINSQADFDNWVKGCNDFISSLYVPKMNVLLNTDITAAGTEGSLVENFRGTLDGQGHTITMNMKNETEAFGLGLIRYLEGTIKNVAFTGTLEGNGKHIAPVAMDLNPSGVAENIYCDVNIISHTNSPEAYHGGIFARTPGGVMRNIIYAGKITDPEGKAFAIGGILGNSVSTAKTTMENIIMAGDLSELTANPRTIGTALENSIPSNVFTINADHETPAWCTVITAEELASGKFCFLFNGDQRNMKWYQTLGQDATPVLDATHKKVYADGEYNCDGSPKGEGSETFNNEGGSTIPNHEYKDGYCENCGHKDPNYVDVLDLEQDEEGNYLIGTAEDLMAFARGVNNDTFRKANVKLTADIDMSGFDWYPIGYTSTSYSKAETKDQLGYAGTFDGQGHVIYNATLTENQSFTTSGIFGTITGTVRNLGVSGYYVNRAMSGRQGGFCGVLVEGTIENCYIIESTVVHPTNGEIYALMAAGNYGGTISNSYEYDNIIENYPRAGQFVGDNRDDNSVRFGKVINCYSGSFVTGEGRDSGYTGGKTNCEDKVSAERFESGEIAYKLNGSTFSANPAWRQELGVGYPTLDPEMPIIVVTLAGTTMNVSAENGLTEFASAIAEEEYDYIDELICQKDLTEPYIALIEQMEDGDFDEEGFTAILGEMTTLRAAIQKNAAAYTSYQEKVDEVAQYMDENANFDGPGRDKLEKYLTQMVEPDSALFPNGSYEFIMQNLLLPDASLSNEKAFVQALLDEAIATGYQPGADVTNMIANADFANGNIGWAVNTMSTTTVGDAEVKYVGESGVALNIRQTITNLRPGLYQVTAYAAYRADGNNQSYNQASFVYAGESKTYASVLMEEMVEDSEYASKYTAVTDIEGNTVGYIPTNATAMAYAFSEGLYRHVLVAEVGADSTLTIGVMTPGCQTSNTTWVGPFTMQYLGQADSEFAAPALSKAIRCQQAHLATLAEKYPEFCADNNNHKAAPNYSTALAAQVATAATAAVAGNTDGMLQQTAQLGEMMQEVYDTKTAYAAMMAKAEVLQEISSEMAIAELITAEEAALMDDSYGMLTNAYLDGSFTRQEAENINPFEGINFMPKQEGNLIQIANAKELIMFSAMVNGGMAKEAQVELTADIDMEGIAFFPPIAYSDPAHNGAKAYDINFICFTGVFDGKGHSIKNLTAAYNSNYWASGVFGNNQGTIRNLIVDGYKFQFGDRAAYAGRHAALCGVNYGTIENCAVINSVVDHSGEIVSAIAAGNYDGTVRACFEARNRINPYTRAGMLVGDNRDDNNNRKGTIIDCFSTDYVSGEGRTSPYTGTQINSVNHCKTFATGEVAYLLNKYNEGHPECMTWKQNIGDDATPVLDQTHLDVLNTAAGYSNYDGLDNELNTLLKKANNMIKTLTFTGEGGAAEGVPLVTDASQLSSNCQWDGNYGMENVLNDNSGNYFHSNAGGSGPAEFAAGQQWMQIDLDKPIYGFHMEYTGRSDGPAANKWHDTPNKIRVLATNTPDDENSWVEICTQEYPEIPNQNGAYFHTAEPILLGAAYKHIRLNVLRTTTGNNWWNIVTFQMWAAGSGTTIAYVDEHPEVKPAVDALQALCNAAAGKIANHTTTEQDVADMKEAIAVLRALIPDSVIKFEGTKDDPIYLTTADELTRMRKRMKAGQITYFRLANDIDMAEVADWTPLNTVAENYKNFIDFDGQGHVISNFSCTTAAQQYNSFFGILCGDVRNVGFDNANVTCALSGAGILGAYIGHEGFVVDGQQLTSQAYNVWVTGTINATGSYTGGLFGNVGRPAYIKNVYTNVAVTATGDYVGGFIGRVRDKLTIKQAYAAGTISQGGGIIGGGQQEATPAGTYQDIVVWNNTDENFGPIKAAYTGPVGNLPTADLFELQVNADGTVADKSAMANTIQTMGNVEVKYNKQFDTYSYMSKAEGDAAINFLKIDYSTNEAMKAAITDGFTMECIFAIDNEFSSSKKPFCATEGGGFGIELLSNTTLQTPLHTDVEGTKGYKSANVTGVKVQAKTFYHAVAVYNADTKKITLYVNGYNKAESNADGIVHFPDNPISQWIGIGADPSGSENVGQAAGNFEIVAARIYNDPITEAQAKALYLTQFNRSDILDGDLLEGISYFNGDNFANLQTIVVGWGEPWQCGMAEGEYPTFDPTKTAINSVKAQPKTGRIYNINGIEVEKAENGIFIINGKKVMVK